MTTSAGQPDPSPTLITDLTNLTHSNPVCRHGYVNLTKHLRCSILSLAADPQSPAAPLANAHHDDARLKTSAELFNHGSVPHTPAGQPITCWLSVGGTLSFITGSLRRPRSPNSATTPRHSKRQRVCSESKRRNNDSRAQNESQADRLYQNHVVSYRALGFLVTTPFSLDTNKEDISALD